MATPTLDELFQQAKTAFADYDTARQAYKTKKTALETARDTVQQKRVAADATRAQLIEAMKPPEDTPIP